MFVDVPSLKLFDSTLQLLHNTETFQATNHCLMYLRVNLLVVKEGRAVDESPNWASNYYRRAIIVE